MKKIFLFASVCKDRSVAKITRQRYATQEGFKAFIFALPAVSTSAAFITAVIRVMNICYGCRETTTRPDRELVIPLQYTVVELA